MILIIAIAAHCVPKASETTPSNVAMTPPEMPTTNKEDISFAFCGKCFNAKEKIMANRLEYPSAMTTVADKMVACDEQKRSPTSPCSLSALKRDFFMVFILKRIPVLSQRWKKTPPQKATRSLGLCCTALQNYTTLQAMIKKLQTA